jgi:hypothetical protein
MTLQAPARTGPLSSEITGMMERMLTAAACDPCADYHRDQRRRGEMIGRLGMALKYTQEAEEREAISQAARTLMLEVLESARKFHRVEGLDWIEEWFTTWLEDPDYGTSHTRVMVRRAADHARTCHPQLPSFG